MRFTIALTVASAIGLSNAFFSPAKLASQFGQVQTENRPRLAHMLSHLEKSGKLTWEDHELGNGVKVAVYDMKDWNDAKTYLGSASETGHSETAHGPEMTPAPRAMLAPRMPQDEGDSIMPGGSIVPVLPDETTATTAVSSGTSTAPMADNTAHGTKWVCKQPYNIPVSLGEGALASVICQYIFPFLQNLFTGPADTVIQRTVSIPTNRADDPTIGARIAIHVEKNQLWPALKAVLCSTLLVQIANNAYCWGYGEGFSTSSRKRQSTLDGTVGGTVWIYDTTGTAPVGLVEMETMEE